MLGAILEIAKGAISSKQIKDEDTEDELSFEKIIHLCKISELEKFNIERTRKAKKYLERSVELKEEPLLKKESEEVEKNLNLANHNQSISEQLMSLRPPSIFRIPTLELPVSSLSNHIQFLNSVGKLAPLIMQDNTGLLIKLILKI